MPQVNRDDGDLLQVRLVPNDPVEEGVIQGAVGVENEEAAFASGPVGDVLPDEVFQHFGFAGAGRAADVKMRRAHLRRHFQWGAGAVHQTELHFVARKAGHILITLHSKAQPERAWRSLPITMYQGCQNVTLVALL